MTRTPAVSTFSIVARDPATGDLGVATASKFLAVGAVVPYAEAGRGAVATQSYANTTFGPRTMMALRGGISLDLIHQAFAESDAQHAQRQYGLVDALGNSLTFTGDDCHPWAGGKHGENYAAQDNLLVGPEVVEGLEQTFLEIEGALPRTPLSRPSRRRRRWRRQAWETVRRTLGRARGRRLRRLQRPLHRPARGRPPRSQWTNCSVY